MPCFAGILLLASRSSKTLGSSPGFKYSTIIGKRWMNSSKIRNFASVMCKVGEKCSAEQHLKEHSVRLTAVRQLVWRAVSPLHHAFSLGEVEELLPQMDRSSIFRTLRLFVEKDLLHGVDDGSGCQKYCVCRCESDHHEAHVHFFCVRCGKTYCLSNSIVPHVPLPEGFQSQQQEFVIKGLCAQCSLC